MAEYRSKTEVKQIWPPFLSKVHIFYRGCDISCEIYHTVRLQPHTATQQPIYDYGREIFRLLMVASNGSFEHFKTQM